MSSNRSASKSITSDDIHGQIYWNASLFKRGYFHDSSSFKRAGNVSSRAPSGSILSNKHFKIPKVCSFSDAYKKSFFDIITELSKPFEEKHKPNTIDELKALACVYSTGIAQKILEPIDLNHAILKLVDNQNVQHLLPELRDFIKHNIIFFNEICSHNQENKSLQAFLNLINNIQTSVMEADQDPSELTKIKLFLKAFFTIIAIFELPIIKLTKHCYQKKLGEDGRIGKHIEDRDDFAIYKSSHLRK